jgi:hypothetical protein
MAACDLRGGFNRHSFQTVGKRKIVLPLLGCFLALKGE